MRVLSDIEQSMILTLLSSDEYRDEEAINFFCLLERLGYGKKVDLYFEKKNGVKFLALGFPKKVELMEKKEVQLHILKLAALLELLSLLEREGYILLLKGEERTSGMLIADKPNQNNLVGITGPTLEKFYNLVGTIIVPTEQLRVYQKNGFKSEESIRHEEMLRISWFTIAVAIGAIIVSVVVK